MSKLELTESEILKCMIKDQYALRQSWSKIQQISTSNKRKLAQNKWQARLLKSQNLCVKRSSSQVHIEYPPLPVSDKKEEIKKYFMD